MACWEVAILRISDSGPNWIGQPFCKSNSSLSSLSFVDFADFLNSKISRLSSSFVIPGSINYPITCYNILLREIDLLCVNFYEIVLIDCAYLPHIIFISIRSDRNYCFENHAGVISLKKFLWNDSSFVAEYGFVLEVNL